jgi:hypothetical protein
LGKKREGEESRRGRPEGYIPAREVTETPFNGKRRIDKDDAKIVT